MTSVSEPSVSRFLSTFSSHFFRKITKPRRFMDCIRMENHAAQAKDYLIKNPHAATLLSMHCSHECSRTAPPTWDLAVNKGLFLMHTERKRRRRVQPTCCIAQQSIKTRGKPHRECRTNYSSLFSTLFCIVVPSERRDLTIRLKSCSPSIEILCYLSAYGHETIEEMFFCIFAVWT